MTAMTASSVDCDHANLTDRVNVAGVDHHSTVAEFWNGLTPTSIKCDGQPFQKTMVRPIVFLLRSFFFRKTILDLERAVICRRGVP